MPRGLANGAKTEWRRLAGGLEAVGILTPLDAGVFAAYCIGFASMMAAHRKDDLNSYVKASTAMRLAANELGLTPAARARLVVDAGTEAPDAWGELIPT